MNAAILSPEPNAPPEPNGVRFIPLQADQSAADLARLDALMAIEQASYSHPWSRGNFLDSVRSGYLVQLLLAEEQLLGYFVAMKGYDEVHLLNITVAPEQRAQGWAPLMLDALKLWTRAQQAHTLWLEVRRSNARARAVYERYGFVVVGERKRYYPLSWTKREDAIVMSLTLDPPTTGN
jgi:ribosomal-protein-alanine N-acetyltransferase